MSSRAVLEVLVGVASKGLLRTAQLFGPWFGVLGYRRIADEVRAGRLGVGVCRTASVRLGCAWLCRRPVQWILRVAGGAALYRHRPWRRA